MVSHCGLWCSPCEVGPTGVCLVVRADKRVQKVFGPIQQKRVFAGWLGLGVREDDVDGLSLHSWGRWSDCEHEGFPQGTLGLSFVSRWDEDSTVAVVGNLVGQVRQFTFRLQAFNEPIGKFVCSCPQVFCFGPAHPIGHTVSVELSRVGLRRRDPRFISVLHLFAKLRGSPKFLEA